MIDHENPLWKRPKIRDNVLQRSRYLFWNEITDTQKQAEIDYQIRKNKELVK